MTTKRITLLALACAPLAAQATLNDPRGVFHAVPHFLSLASPPSTIPELAWKPPGDIPGFHPIAGMPTGNAPDLRINVMFPTSYQHVKFDAISSGNDPIPTPNANGELIPDPQGAGWLALTFSVTPLSTRNNSIMNLRLPNNGGDIYGYVVPGSNTVPATSGVPIVMVDQLYLEQGSEHMGLPVDANIDAHDAYLPYVQEGQPAPSPLLLNNKHFFFSLTRASATALNQNVPNWLPGLPLQSAHPADIYQITWNSALPGWSAPFLYRHRSQMGLTVNGDNYNIDALAVRFRQNDIPGTGTILFSTESPMYLGESLLVQAGPGGVVQVPRDRFGKKIVLVNTGDVDGVSVYDPETLIPNRCLGFPVARMDLPGPTLAMSMSKLGLDSGGTQYLLSVSGFRPTDTGAVALVASINNGTPIQFGSFVIAGRTTATQVSVPALGNASCDVWATYLSGPNRRYSWAVRIMIP